MDCVTLPVCLFKVHLVVFLLWKPAHQQVSRKLQVQFKHPPIFHAHLRHQRESSVLVTNDTFTHVVTMDPANWITILHPINGCFYTINTLMCDRKKYLGVNHNAGKSAGV
uniref:Secreted protein n=1 Tax=Mesocestoides corti TaxID=53468 RepID=A0A5K3FUP1_MESCO